MSPGRKCTKCGGLNRIDGDDLVCLNCGHRVYGGDLQEKPAVVTVDVPRAGDRVAVNATQNIAVRFFDSIASQRKAGASFETIARLLTLAGHRCGDKTLQKYFLLEQAKRCGDEKREAENTTSSAIA